MKKIVDYTFDEIRLIITNEKFNDLLYCSENSKDFVDKIDDEINKRIDFCDKMMIEPYQLGIKRKVLHTIRYQEKEMLYSLFNDKRILEECNIIKNGDIKNEII